MSRKLPDILTPQERASLLAQPNGRYPTGKRNRAALYIMLDCGLRVSEVCGLCRQDYDRLTGRLRVVQGKGAKDRILWANGATSGALDSWLDYKGGTPFDGEGPRGGYILTTRHGGPLSSRYLRAMVARYGARAAIPKKVYPHLLRHTFASDLYAATKDIRLVQKALGHADLSSTMIYTHLVDGALEGALKGFRE